VSQSPKNLSHLQLEQLEDRQMLSTVSIFAAGVTGTESIHLNISDVVVWTFENVQAERFSKLNILYNAEMSSTQLRKFCKLTDDCVSLSARAHDKVLRLSRTIADLDSAEEIRFEHLSEAINYRQLDRDIWS